MKHGALFFYVSLKTKAVAKRIALDFTVNSKKLEEKKNMNRNNKEQQQ